MARSCKCKICGKELTTDIAYCVKINNKNFYYCNEEEFNMLQKEKECQKQIHNLCCEILDRKQIINPALQKEMNTWHIAADWNVILNYLKENMYTLTNTMSRVNGSEYGRIRYLSKIISSNISDYRVPIFEPIKKLNIDIEMYDVKTPLPKRRSLSDLEDLL